MGITCELAVGIQFLTVAVEIADHKEVGEVAVGIGCLLRYRRTLGVDALLESLSVALCCREPSTRAHATVANP